MSARVFNPLPLFEMRGTMRSGAGFDANEERRARVRVNLFGEVNHDEVKRTLEKELAEQQRKAIEKYNFHFPSGKPLDGQGGRYEWQPTEEEPGVPAPYELRGMPYIRSHAVVDEVVEMRTVESPEEEEPSTSRVKTSETSAATASPSPVYKKQSRITDFHQKRKRMLSQPSKTSPSASATQTSSALASTSGSDSSPTLFKKARLQKS